MPRRRPQTELLSSSPCPRQGTPEPPGCFDGSVLHAGVICSPQLTQPPRTPFGDFPLHDITQLLICCQPAASREDPFLAGTEAPGVGQCFVSAALHSPVAPAAGTAQGGGPERLWTAWITSHIGARGCQGSNPAATFLHCHQQELSDVVLSPSTSSKKADTERGAAPISRCQGQPSCCTDAVPPSTIITSASFPASWQDSAICSPTKQPSVQFRYDHLSQKRKAMKQPWQSLNAWHHAASL